MKVNFKESDAAKTTITYDRNQIDAPTENLYEAIAVIARRASQLNVEIKEELRSKLDEFATHNDNLEEIFENKEQIEVSRFYERLPKPTALAVEEWLQSELEFRYSDKKEK